MQNEGVIRRKSSGEVEGGQKAAKTEEKAPNHIRTALEN